jgi:hypothetical protein
MLVSKEIKEREFKPLPLKKLKRVFDTAEKGLSRYMPTIYKYNNFFTLKELERLFDLGHTAEDFNFLLEGLTKHQSPPKNKAHNITIEDESGDQVEP